jgi:hypothetical protein
LFEIKIKIHESQNYLEFQDQIEFDDGLDDITSLVMDICNYFDEMNLVSFVVKGFNDMKWPVDVRTDLSSIIPQVPNAIEKLTNRQKCNIQFFEQGIERELRFKCDNNDVIIECFSLFGDPVTLETEKIRLDELLRMLIALLDNFIKISKRVCPKITNHSLFKEWETAY